MPGCCRTFDPHIGSPKPERRWRVPVSSAHVDVNPEHSDEFVRYRDAVAHLNEEKKENVRRYAKSLPNLWKTPPIDVDIFGAATVTSRR